MARRKKTDLKAAAQRERNPIQHAIEVLQCFDAQASLLGVTEIAERVGVHKSTVSRILATLGGARFVERDEATGRYRIGSGIVTLAAPLMANLSFVEVARPHLDALARQSRETVTLSVWSAGEAIDVAQAQGLEQIKYAPPLGMKNPAHCTATGKVFLAEINGEELPAALHLPLKRHTPRTLCDVERLRADLKRVRERGYALNEEEFQLNLSAVAAPIRDHTGRLIATLAVSVPKFRFGADQKKALIRLMTETAGVISERLGHQRAAK